MEHEPTAARGAVPLSGLAAGAQDSLDVLWFSCSEAHSLQSVLGSPSGHAATVRGTRIQTEHLLGGMTTIRGVTWSHCHCRRTLRSLSLPWAGKDTLPDMSLQEVSLSHRGDAELVQTIPTAFSSIVCLVQGAGRGTGASCLG